MKAYLTDFLRKFDYPNAAQTSILQTYETLLARGGAEELRAVVSAYRARDIDYRAGIEKIKELAQKTDINEYALVLLYLIFLVDVLLEQYEEKGIEESVWFDTVSDLKYKAFDCEGLYGVWGDKDAGWHGGFFEFKKFGFEKLQFQLCTFGYTYEKNGLKLKEDDAVVAVHVPRTGEKLDYESVQRAYKKALCFFRKYFAETFENKPIVFTFKSWMLFDKLKKILPPQSNFMRFCADFDVFRKGEDEDYSSAWRVFYKPYEGDISKMPQDTSLQRAYAKMIERGEKLGWGHGVYFPKEL